jgi:archaellum biogenesis ATPase FlaH
MEVFNDAMKEIMNPRLGIEIPAWSKFSEFTGGMRMSEFTIFCGATGAGKTQFLANLTYHLVHMGIKCFVAPVETGDVDFATRMISVAAGRDFNTGEKFLREDFSVAMGENQLCFNNNVIFSTHDNRVDIIEMIETLKYMVEVEGVQVAILDNLNFFLKPTTANQQMLEQDEAVHAFVMLAKKIKIHLFLVMHPRKTDGGKIMSEFDIKGSSTAVQEASNVLIMNRPSDEEVQNGVNPLSREFFFTKIRKRGFNVRKRFYLEYRGGCYHEPTGTQGTLPFGSTHTSGDNSLRGKKRGGVPDYSKARSGDGEPSL